MHVTLVICQVQTQRLSQTAEYYLLGVIRFMSSETSVGIGLLGIILECSTFLTFGYLINL
jgi:hypothetical protein